jgi:hypothetical protein
MYLNTAQNAYGPIIGRSPQGFPVYLYTDPHSRRVSYVVVFPNGQPFYSNDKGLILGQPAGEADAEVAGAIVTGTLGALAGGPVGGIIGAIAGAVAGKLLKKQSGI